MHLNALHLLLVSWPRPRPREINRKRHDYNKDLLSKNDRLMSIKERKKILLWFSSGRIVFVNCSMVCGMLNGSAYSKNSYPYVMPLSSFLYRFIVYFMTSSSIKRNQQCTVTSSANSIHIF